MKINIGDIYGIPKIENFIYVLFKCLFFSEKAKKESSVPIVIVKISLFVWVICFVVINCTYKLSTLIDIIEQRKL